MTPPSDQPLLFDVPAAAQDRRGTDDIRSNAWSARTLQPVTSLKKVAKKLQPSKEVRREFYPHDQVCEWSSMIACPLIACVCTTNGQGIMPGHSQPLVLRMYTRLCTRRPTQCARVVIPSKQS